MRAQIIACLIPTILASFDVQATVSADELVKFESAPFLLGQIQQRQARERGETPKLSSDTIEGCLSKPDGGGPFAAVVYPTDATGFRKTSERVSPNS